MAAFVLLATVASADAPRHSIVYESLTGGQSNPTGLASFFDIQYRYRLYDENDGFTKDCYVGLGGRLEISPVWVRAGVVFETVPIAPILFRADFTGYQTFGILGSTAVFPTADTDFSSKALDARTEQGLATAMTGFTVGVELHLRAAWDVFVIRNIIKARYWAPTNLGDDDRAFYAAGDMTLLPVGGWHMENIVEAAGFFVDDQLLVALRYRLVTAFHNGSDPNGPFHLIGPALGWRIKTDNPRFNDPTIVAHVAWFINHANRNGPLPYFAFAVYFDGTLWSR